MQLRDLIDCNFPQGHLTCSTKMKSNESKDFSSPVARKANQDIHLQQTTIYSVILRTSGLSIPNLKKAWFLLTRKNRACSHVKFLMKQKTKRNKRI